MKQLLTALAFVVLTIHGHQASALATLPPCSRPVEWSISPGHPGSTDPVNIWVTINDPPSWFDPDTNYLLGTTSINPATATVTIDLVYTDDERAFPSRCLIDTYGDSPASTLGVLPAGTYAVQISIRAQDPTSRQTAAICPAMPVTSFVLVVSQMGSTSTTLSVIEFYNAKLDHYFVTGDQQEIADLDNGIHVGWTRTRESFLAYSPTDDDNRGRPLARYYGLPEAGLDSHLYTWSHRELAGMQMKGLFANWKFEGAAVFKVGTPDTSTGVCAPGTIPVYRVWNQRVDSNHRYTINRNLRDTLLRQGWISEGFGGDKVFMCAIGI